MDFETDPWRVDSPEVNVSETVWQPINNSSNGNMKPFSSSSLQEEANKRLNDDYTGTGLFNNNLNVSNDKPAIGSELYAGDSVWENTGFKAVNQDPDVQGLTHFQATDTPQYAANDEYRSWVESIRKTYSPLSDDIVVVEEIPEREGLVFKHTNYSIKHLIPLPGTDPSEDRTVVRRYSDFDWLQDVLLRKYPFRMIPELPPKKIGSQNADPLFLAKRRKGLSRFINLVMKHPILKKDDLVLTFLTVPTDLSSWRKQAQYDTSEEFMDKRISGYFMKLWRKEFSEQWNKTDEKIDSVLDTWVKVTVLVERYEKRMKQVGHERRLMSNILGKIPEATQILYPQSSDTVLQINEGVELLAGHLNACADVIDQENREVEEGLSVKFKVFIDVIIALKGLFERYKMMAGNNIPQLQRRVEINQEKLTTLEGNPNVKGAEYDRVKQSIARDKRGIIEQMNRSWLIRECILQEFTIFQETQFLITDCLQRWIEINLRHSNQNVDNWEKICQKLSDMPIERR
ncbi:Sorting nexin mvp1 [Kluyveromyces marxianus]|nr:Sorting nexin mvp1 [Kluyveromyces marxianus]KAG0685536.1 Sorting nexin mvp1 [Kluyveromyces marxianus]